MCFCCGSLQAIYKLFRPFQAIKCKLDCIYSITSKNSYSNSLYLQGFTISKQINRQLVSCCLSTIISRLLQQSNSISHSKATAISFKLQNNREATPIQSRQSTKEKAPMLHSSPFQPISAERQLKTAQMSHSHRQPKPPTATNTDEATDRSRQPS